MAYENTKLMKMLKLLFIALAFLPGAAMAQGTFLFTWHGSSNLFQASFEVTAAEMQPGAEWNSPLFLNSMSVTNPLGYSYHGGSSSSLGGGGVYPDGSTWYVTFQLNDYSRGTEVLLGGQGSQGLIHEKPFSGPDTYYEPGYWSYTVIPEPSTGALLALGVAAWAIKTGLS
jgi:hypothetical protein